MPRYTINQHAFASITTEAQAYWLGFLWADGSIYINYTGNRNDKRLTVRINKHDIAHLEAFREFLGSSHKFVHYADNSVSLALNSKTLVDNLIEHGIVARKSYQPNFDCLNHIPEHLHVHFWRGAIDGDGYTKNNEKAMIGFCGNLASVEAFKKFCSKALGRPMQAKIHKVKIAECWFFQITCTQARALSEILYKGAVIALPRKLEKARTFFNRASKESGRYARMMKYRKLKQEDQFNPFSQTVSRVFD
jgi:hypothetical protein